MASAIYVNRYMHISSLQGAISYDKIEVVSFELSVVMESLCTFHGRLNFEFPRICSMKWA